MLRPRRYLFGITLAVLSIQLVACSAPAIAPTQRPNFLIIIADDHAKRAISAYDSGLVETPNIDRIAEEGAIFRNAFVTNSICAPSRAVILTGKHSHLNGLRDNRDVFEGDQQTFPKLLQKAGYETAVIGKWHLKSDPQGFDTWNILIGQGEYYAPRFNNGDSITQYDGSYVSDKITDLTLDFLESRDRSRPFALLYNHKAPHRNWMPPPKYLAPDYEKAYEPPESFRDTYEGREAAAVQDMRIENMFLSNDAKLLLDEYSQETGSGGAPDRTYGARYSVDNLRNSLERMSDSQVAAWHEFMKRVRAGYEAAKADPDDLLLWQYQRYINDYIGTVRSIDDNLGRVLDYLDEHDLAENTIVIYTSDQGFYLGEHGWYDKRFMYEESMGTPLLIRYPSEVSAGIEVQHLAQNLDLAQTVLDFANVAAPPSMQGLSLRSVLQAQPADNWRTALYYHYYEYPHGWHSVHRHYGIRTDRYKLIHFYGEIDHWELFDLDSDPGETQNLWDDASYRPIRNELHRQLLDLMQHYGDTTSEES